LEINIIHIEKESEEKTSDQCVGKETKERTNEKKNE
jgi:hypothetical protein